MDIKQEIKKKVRFQIHRAKRIWPGFSISVPEIIYKKRGRSAGSCRCRRMENGEWNATLDFNLPMAEFHKETFIKDTPVHEVSHYIDVVVHGYSSGHGDHWRYVMKKLGAEKIDRCHNMEPVDCKSYRLFDYHCDCRNHQLTAVRHNRIRKASRSYLCKKCKGLLREGKRF